MSPFGRFPAGSTRYTRRPSRTLMALGEADTTTRQRRQLGEQAIAQATRGEWEEAVATNRQLLELGPGHRCLQPARQGARRAGPQREALEAYEQALERDATNRIAQRNVERLRLLIAADKPSKKNGKGRTDKAPATLFIEEMGKTGHARLINLAAPRVLAPLSPGDAVELVVEGDELVAHVGGAAIGSVEPRIAARLGKLMTAATATRPPSPRSTRRRGADGSSSARPSPTRRTSERSRSRPSVRAAAGVRPYMKGSALRYDDEDEVEEAEEDSEEVEELDTTLPEYSGEPELEEELVEEP